MSEKKVIRVSEDLHAALFDLKRGPDDTYEDVLRRQIDLPDDADAVPEGSA